MKTTVLPGTDVATTVLGLGCADLFRLPSAQARAEVLHAAYDSGIRHFDTAPMYGLGRAEPELGRFLRHRRDQAVVATKFGIRPSGPGRAIGAVQGPVRRLLAAAPALQAQARRGAAGPSSGPAGSLLYTSSGFDAAAAERSLTASLRALGTDHVDLFLLHDPAPGRVRSDEVRAFCERARADGRIRAWGVAGEPAPSRAVARAFGAPAPLLQLRAHSPYPGATAAGWPAITFGVLGENLQAVRHYLTTADADAVERRRRWSDEIGADCAEPRVLARFLVRRAVGADRSGAVLVGTTRPAHVRDLAAAAADAPTAPNPAMDAFHRLLDQVRQHSSQVGSRT